MDDCDCDEDLIPKEGCRQCSFCIDGKSVLFDQAHDCSRNERIDKTKIKATLFATNIRDTRFLAIIAYEISYTSYYRAIGETCDLIFESMDDCDFSISISGMHAF